MLVNNSVEHSNFPHTGELMMSNTLTIVDDIVLNILYVLWDWVLYVCTINKILFMKGCVQQFNSYWYTHQSLML